MSATRINMDFTKTVVIHTPGVDWSASRAPGVERRMLEREHEESEPGSGAPEDLFARFEVVDTLEAPIRGARISWQSDAESSELGITDAEGSLAARVPAPPPIRIAASAADSASRASPTPM